MNALANLQALDQQRPWVLDAALALGLFAAALLTATSTTSTVPGLQVGLIGLTALCFAARRLAPAPVLVLTGALVVVMIWLGYGTAVIGSGLFLAAYSVAAHRSVRATVFAAVYVLVLLTGVAVAFPARMPLDEYATNVALFAGAFVLGRAARVHREAARLEAERNQLVEQARRDETRAAINAERLRIAREVHDVVGHSLGVIALQAGVGARMVEADPDEAKAALDAIATRSRASLREIRQLLGAIRDPDDEPEGLPGLAQASDLFEAVERAGVHVEVERAGEPWSLPTAMDLTAYRVLQESLTNVVRHAATERAWVSILYSPEGLELRIRDRRDGPMSAGHEAGGLLGMRERVATWGGTLATGPAADGGYEVVARLPRQEVGS